MVQQRQKNIKQESNSLTSESCTSVVDAVLDAEQPISNSKDHSVIWSSHVVHSIDPLILDIDKSAVLAPSCLVQPNVGDLVLCVTPKGCNPVVVSLLIRKSPQTTLLIQTEVPVELRSPQFDLLSHTVSVMAERAECNVGVIRRLADRIDEVVEYFSSSVGTAFLRAKRSIKRVEELDEIKA